MRNELLDQLAYDSANGTITLLGSRYFLVRPETLGEIYEQVERRHPDSLAEIFFAAGHTGLSSYLRSLADDRLLDKSTLIAQVIETGSNLGWGRIRLRSFDTRGKRMEFEVVGSVFARGGGEAPMCHTFRGVFAALGETVFDGPVVVEEVECVGVEGEVCVFVVGRE